MRLTNLEKHIQVVSSGTRYISVLLCYSKSREYRMLYNNAHPYQGECSISKNIQTLISARRIWVVRIITLKVNLIKQIIYQIG